MRKSESYVDYKNQPLNLVRFINVEIELEKRKIKNARIVIVRDGKRSLIGRDWLAQLNYLVAVANSNSEHSTVVGHIKTLELERLEN